MEKRICGALLAALWGMLAAGLCPAYADGPAASDSVGPAFDIGGDVVLGPPIEYQVDAAVAFDGTNFLVVWGDYRSKTSNDIFGARVAPDGTVLDEGGFIISDAPGQQATPAVAFDGDGYLVVWADRRSGTDDIYGARVTPGGAVLDPDGLPICTEAGGQADVAIAFGDTCYFVVWADTRSGNDDIYGARVAPDGAVLDSGGTALCVDPASQRYPTTAHNGAGWLVVWADRRSGQLDIYGTRVTYAGAVLDSGGIPVAVTSADEAHAAVAYNGSECLVTWGVDMGATSYDIYATRVDTAGAVLDSGIVVCDDPAYQGYPAVSTNGPDYFVVWDDYRNGDTWDVYGARIDSTGAVIDTTSLALSLEPSQQFGLATAFDGSKWLIAWHDSRNDHKDIFAIRVGSDGTVLDPASFLISVASVDEAEAAVAYDGAGYLVVWHEWREETLYDIRATRVSADGTVLDPAGISVCVDSSDAMYPAVCFGGSDYLVAWQDYRNGEADIYAARIAPDGTVLDPGGFSVSLGPDDQERPAVTFNGVRYLVVWQDRRRGDFDIRASRVDPDGTVLEAWGIPVSEALMDQARPSAASDGLDFFVVWEDARNVYDDIFGTRVRRNGAVLDSSGIAIASAPLAQEHPDVVFDGDRYAVVWQDYRTNVDYDIYLSRVTADGTVLDPSGIIVSGAAGDQQEPAIAFNGREYLMIWQDGRGSAGLDIYGARADTSGAVSDPSGFEVSGAANHQMTPDVCTTPIGVALMIYSSFISDPGYGSYRVWGNFFDTVAGVPPGAAQGSAYLYPNSPNPFRSRTTLRFTLGETADVKLAVYDVLGRRVVTLIDGPRAAGMYDIDFDSASTAGHALAPGLYFVDFRAGACRRTRKMLLLE